MADQPVDHTVPWRPYATQDWTQRGRRAVLVLLTLMLVLGGALVGRRMVGALDRDLPTVTLIVLACAAAVASIGLRTAWRRLDVPPPNYLTQFLGWGSSLALLLWAIGCSFPGHRLIEWCVWLPLLAADQFFRHAFLVASDGQAVREPLDAEPSVLEQRAAGVPIEEFDSGEARRDDLSRGPMSESPDPRLLQQLFRVREANGQDRIYGTLLADFEQGQRVAAVHVAFCPPLGLRPEVAAKPHDFPDAQVKVTQALAHGARIDVRLSEPADESCSVPIKFSARSPLGKGLAL